MKVVVDAQAERAGEVEVVAMVKVSDYRRDGKSGDGWWVVDAVVEGAAGTLSAGGLVGGRLIHTLYRRSDPRSPYLIVP